MYVLLEEVRARHALGIKAETPLRFENKCSLFVLNRRPVTGTEHPLMPTFNKQGQEVEWNGTGKDRG